MLRLAQRDSASHEQVLANQFANSRLSSFNSATNASMLKSFIASRCTISHLPLHVRIGTPKRVRMKRSLMIIRRPVVQASGRGLDTGPRVADVPSQVLTSAANSTAWGNRTGNRPQYLESAFA